MTLERLYSLPYEKVVKIAVKEGIRIDDTFNREDLIALILEALEENEEERKADNNNAMSVSGKKFDILKEPLLPEDEEEYELPEMYNENKIVLMLRDPLWSYAYWDIDKRLKDGFRQDAQFKRLFLRIHQVSSDEVYSVFEIDLQLSDSTWYINLPRQSSSYFVEIVVEYREETVLAVSNTVVSPVSQVNLGLHGKDSYEELLLLAGLSNNETNLATASIPQRISSVLDSKYLED